LVLTQSRSALIALVIAGAVIVLLRWRWGWVAILGAALAAGALYLAGYFPSQAALSAGVHTIFGSLGLEERLELWSRAIYASQDFPFTGIGLGAFNEVVDLLYPLFLVGPGKASHAHNLFLQIAVDLGIPGVIAWLAILLGVLTTAWQLYRFGRQVRQPLAAALGAGFLGSQAALIIHGLTDAVTWGMVRPAPLVWAIWGLAVGAWLVMTAPQKNEFHGRVPVSSGDA
jgi:putative inorganic carbon (HCO3(-)) transporter